MKLVRRSHACVSIYSGHSHLVVDAGKFNLAEVGALAGCDAAIISHQHPDHFDAGVISAIAPRLVFLPSDVEVANTSLRSRCHTIEPNVPFEAAGFLITAFDVNHGPKLSRPVRNFGFRFEVGRVAIAYLGDIAVPGPVPVLSDVSVVLLPIGGNGFVFNADEAASFLRSIAYDGLVVPVHDLGPSDPRGASRLAELAGSDFRVQILAPGESIELGVEA